ncbi:TetR/AcrR family transcriptional regulator [Aestuariimicrobium sp. T2.26MG-19.2B]|uniref:TetR/AcrR family transcriptional regulator n=1 Tax=Aestuariimicrobium sp. T2.26MG-19.2B TaxID=3040679 RepID=UPI0025420696|nr:TetR family transcriptional regulator [Aestuariimicrobium sp. T2.26MG-19.2B]
MTSQRERVLDAAIEVLGTQGLRALTHRRVDLQAGLAAGSTSNHFRTREALVMGVSEAIPERELRGFEDAVAPGSVEELVDLLVALIDHATDGNRTMTAARLALFMEANHHQALRESIWRGHRTMTAFLEPVMTGLGAIEPVVSAGALMACAEGVILHRIARGDDSDAKPLLEVVVRGAFCAS